MDQAGVLSDPAQTGPLGEFPLEERASIGVDPMGDLDAKGALDLLHEPLHPFDKHIVIVLANGITRDQSLIRRGVIRGFQEIAFPQYKDRTTTFQNQAWVVATLYGAFGSQVSHSGMQSVCDPVLVHIQMLWGVGRGHAGQVETHFIREFLYLKAVAM